MRWFEFLFSNVKELLGWHAGLLFCMRSSTLFEEDEETPGWKARRNVARWEAFLPFSVEDGEQSLWSWIWIWSGMWNENQSLKSNTLPSALYQSPRPEKHERCKHKMCSLLHIASCVGEKLESESGNELFAHAQQFYSAHKMRRLRPCLHKSVFKRKRSGFAPFSKIFCVHTSFSYRFHPSSLQHRFRFENAFIPSGACSNELDACAFQYIDPRNCREIEATW